MSNANESSFYVQDIEPLSTRKLSKVHKFDNGGFFLTESSSNIPSNNLCASQVIVCSPNFTDQAYSSNTMNTKIQQLEERGGLTFTRNVLGTSVALLLWKFQEFRFRVDAANASTVRTIKVSSEGTRNRTIKERSCGKNIERRYYDECTSNFAIY